LSRQSVVWGRRGSGVRAKRLHRRPRPAQVIHIFEGKFEMARGSTTGGRPIHAVNMENRRDISEERTDL
jgi:hypothetical protein